MLSLILVRPFYRIRYIGRNNLPKGAFVLCSTHISYFDPVCLGMGIRRKIHFMAKSEFFTEHGFFVRNFFRACGVFPVKRGSADKRSVSTAEALLQKGRIVGIFPHGGISRDGSFSPKAGAALLCCRSSVPMVPAAIITKGKVRPFRKMTVVFGSPIYPGGDSLRSAREMNRELLKETEKLMEEWK